MTDDDQEEGEGRVDDFVAAAPPPDDVEFVEEIEEDRMVGTPNIGENQQNISME